MPGVPFFLSFENLRFSDMFRRCKKGTPGGMEAATEGVLHKKVVLKNSAISHENCCLGLQL